MNTQRGPWVCPQLAPKVAQHFQTSLRQKLQPFINRRKFILLVGFIEAAMIEFGDATVQFEVSMETVVM